MGLSSITHGDLGPAAMQEDRGHPGRKLFAVTIGQTALSLGGGLLAVQEVVVLPQQRARVRRPEALLLSDAAPHLWSCGTTIVTGAAVLLPA